MKQTSERIDEFLSEDARLPLIVKAIRKEPDFLNFQIGNSQGNRLVSENPQLMEFYYKNKRMFRSVVIFQEFIKEIATMLLAKEMVVDMIEAYELCKREDIELETCIDLFNREIIQ
jgi:hypothetical protein